MALSRQSSHQILQNLYPKLLNEHTNSKNLIHIHTIDNCINTSLIIILEALAFHNYLLYNAGNPIVSFN